MNARERKYSRHKFGEDAPACVCHASDEIKGEI